MYRFMELVNTVCFASTKNWETGERTAGLTINNCLINKPGQCGIKVRGYDRVAVSNTVVLVAHGTILSVLMKTLSVLRLALIVHLNIVKVGKETNLIVVTTV